MSIADRILRMYRSYDKMELSLDEMIMLRNYYGEERK